MTLPPLPRAVFRSLPCHACGEGVDTWVYPGDARFLTCPACTRNGARAAAGRCLLCDRGLAHPWVEFCVPCWLGLTPPALERYRAGGRESLCSYLLGFAALLTRRSGYRR